MKQLVCEMCCSNDLVKQDGFFVCQSCGTKYSVEEAKKMMVEGTVKVDYSDFFEKYLANARRAKEKTDWEEVEKYYNMVEQNDPHNIEAIFYSSYGKAMLSLTDSDRFKREQKFNVFGKSISVIDDYYDTTKADDLKIIIQNMSDDLIRMTQTSFVYNTTTQNNVTSNDSSYTYVMFAKAEIQFIESVENIVKKDEKVYLYNILLKHYSRCIQNKKVDFDTSETYQQRMQTTITRLSQLDPGFTPPAIPNVKSGCYVATCVYGSYDCPQVWTLRRYRDYKLDTTWYGRLFIKIYYAVSPTLVKWFGETQWFKKLWKDKLDKMVTKLQEQGYEDTKYEDKQF